MKKYTFIDFCKMHICSRDPLIKKICDSYVKVSFEPRFDPFILNDVLMEEEKEELRKLHREYVESLEKLEKIKANIW